MKYLSATAAVLGLAMLATAPVQAEEVKAGNNNNVNAGNLVNVSLSDTDVLNNIANDLQLQDTIDIPASVQVPVGIAANVCNVAANVLANKNDSKSGECTAETTNDQLNRIVQEQMNAQGG